MRLREALIVGVAATAIGWPGSSIGQFRNPGGSCVYGQHGEVIRAPAGVTCPDRRDHLQDGRGSLATPALNGIPEGMRGNVRRLFTDHAHLVDELARARSAVDIGDRAAALVALDKLSAEMLDHRSREEGLLEEISSQQLSR